MTIQQIPEQFGLLSVCTVTENNHQTQHETAHKLLHQSMQYYAQKYKLTVPKENRLTYNQYGKPAFSEHPELKFNLSHCDGLAVCLISDHECGVDIEPKRHIRSGIIRRVFTQEEQQILAESEQPDWTFTKLWTLKESYVKAIGRGIGFRMQNVSFSWQGEQIICSQEHAECYQILLQEHVISICVLNHENK